MPTLLVTNPITLYLTFTILHPITLVSLTNLQDIFYTVMHRTQISITHYTHFYATSNNEKVAFCLSSVSVSGKKIQSIVTKSAIAEKNISVSYTHLDVYKRQLLARTL